MKRRSAKEIRETNEAACWLRNSIPILKRLQRKLTRTGHRDDSYRRAMIAKYWDQVRHYKLIVEGKI